MAVKIKLQRVGTKNKPMYRIVVQDERRATASNVIEVVGHYNPRQEPSSFEFKKEKVLEWIKKGAQPTDKVRILLGKSGILPLVSFEGRTKRKPKGAVEEKPAEEPKTEEKKAEEKPAEEKPAEEPKAEAAA